jgi:hypothetical protein
MSQSLDLKAMERKAWKSYYQDGMWDIFMGLMMIAMGVDLLTQEGPAFYALMGVTALSPFFIKRFITMPRLGYVKFGPMRRTRNKLVMAVIAFSILIGIGGFVAYTIGAEPPSGVFPAIAVFVIFAVFALMAYLLEFPRLYGYAMAFSLSIGLAITIEDFVPMVLFLTFGGIGLVIGLVMMARFVRRYPVIRTEGTG